MLSRVLISALCLGVCLAASAETIQLKDNAWVSGKILTEKRDQVVVDLGYTVLTVPRKEIVRITKEPAPGSASETRAQKRSGPPRLEQAEAPSRSEKPVRELVTELGEAVVQVRTPGGMGSGFMLNEEGYLITNFHVIEGETQISVEVFHQRGEQLERQLYRRVRIVAMNKAHDLALLKVEDTNAPKFKSVPLGDAEELAVGEQVFAIGSPMGLERTVTEGIVSTKARQVQGSLYLQTTTQINPGNSGGPLFNLRGEVVGVTNMKLVFGEGLGFAIPVENVKYFLKHRESYAYDNDNPTSAYRYLEPPSRLKQAAAGATE